ncbi:response regulator [Rhodanobacter denitrificans]|uniref:Response regulator with CheY-like receiver domain and winged-helix DNA-binding domain n=1 Tax=Rhodanobacter denitrificans TaxID=666685 RepID=I4WY97_9GAMM|nr:response regulator [Rhodanobacter denitrificans]AGG89719.1 response regulator with CheY-like receiver domain and winged-helix DNA-binding domain [Rhodanobacter denitrificans]EIM04439.1 response regulator receiver protein [Rhodanobacter denitrificans]UJJ57895.1 response regulator [Rhodanobacter denitrificans]UJM85118.1 response regulator [Rhodanobacter denitrificans]UJM91769.1 response regulator [Rhodanobacter denitrificans]
MDGHALMNGFGFFKRLLGSQAAAEHRVEPQAALGARMLVVDDSPTICAVLGKMLRQDGYAVLKATDGKEAIELARSERPALIFLDIVMPGMNGFAVLRALRHDPLTRDIPIVMISGNPQATEQFYVQRFGADDFMQKPFDRDEVYLRIGQLVGSGRLDGRLPSAPVPVEALPALAAELSADELADIPDIAMPDAEVAPPLAGVAPLQVVHGIG